MEKIFIRDMKENDWKEVKEIYQQGIDSGIATFMKKVPEYDYWNSTKLKIGKLVAVCNEKIAGWVSLSPTSAREDYSGVIEVSIYVHNDFKGLGIGRKLLQKAIEISEDNHIWTLQAVILRINTASRKLHESCGFRMVGYREKIAKDRFGEWQDSVLLERRSPKVF